MVVGAASSRVLGRPGGQHGAGCQQKRRRPHGSSTCHIHLRWRFSRVLRSERTAFVSDWIASIGLAQISPSHWLRVVGLLTTLMIAGAGWDQAEARSPRNDAPQRVIHGPNDGPPYAAIVFDDKSVPVLHEVNAD